MNNSQLFSPVVKFIIVTAGLVIIIAGLKVSAGMFTVFLLALIFAVTLTPLKNWFERIRESFSP